MFTVVVLDNHRNRMSPGAVALVDQVVAFVRRAVSDTDNLGRGDIGPVASVDSPVGDSYAVVDNFRVLAECKAARMVAVERIPARPAVDRGSVLG